MKSPIPTGEEIQYDGGYMITETDLDGFITFVNRKFSSMTGYSRLELVGIAHSLIRHPDMPKAAFSEMWATLQRGERWDGYVKNLTKDGAFYWVHVFIEPRYNDENEVVGYIAARKIPGTITLERIKKKYEELLLMEEIEERNKGRIGVA